MYIRILGLLALIFSATSSAGYNANMKGKVTHVLTYTSGAQIYFRLENQPSHPTCKANYFSIDASTPDNARQQALSRLLLAYAKGENVNIGYDKESDCSHGYIRVHRVG
ncbi:hypothetical protein SOPP22_01455 [Shewanella sp. OPT22]|nr:hypothetical protein SOPP22_01455 [Shewanella sp. OPT22]